MISRAKKLLPHSVLRAKDRSIANRVPHGAFLYEDISRRLPNETLHVIFDVGANRGQSSHAWAARYPDAVIYAFEPDPTTFQIMKVAVERLNVRPHHLGLGGTDASLRFDTSDREDMHRVADDQSNAALPLVQFLTLDNFCRSHSIAHIDYLKIDTEGHDLDVLKGATDFLGRNAINLVEAECSVNRDNSYHVAFSEVNRFMEAAGYRLFGLYEQANEWPEGLPNLRRVNAVFISPAVIQRNRRRRQ